MTETAAPDYRQMWADLGLDLEMHDVLLGAVGSSSATCTCRRTTAPRAWTTSTS